MSSGGDPVGMRIAVIGAGNVGGTLGRRLAAVGHKVIYGVRDPSAADLPGAAELPAEAVRSAEVVIVALPWAAVEQALAGLDVGEAAVIDATNPLGAQGPARSGAERVAELLGSSRVVKAFNTTGANNMDNPDYGKQRPMMPVAGDDAEAKAIAVGLADQLGFEGLDAGPLSAATDLEHLAELWIRLAHPLGHGREIAFALLRR